LRGIACLGEKSGDVVLQAQQHFGALLLGDVAGESAVAREARAGVEHGLAADAHVETAAVGALAAHQRVAEQDMRVE
jgi:hypothetical protein